MLLSLLLKLLRTIIVFFLLMFCGTPSIVVPRCPVMGFAVCAATFGVCGLWYDTLSLPENARYFQLLYYTSTFFGQVTDYFDLRPRVTCHMCPIVAVLLTVSWLCFSGCCSGARTRQRGCCRRRCFPLKFAPWRTASVQRWANSALCLQVCGMHGHPPAHTHTNTHTHTHSKRLLIPIPRTVVP